MQLFQDKIIELWNEWEIRLLILFSLLLQVILTIFGARRKCSGRIWTRMLVWSSYLTADWVATLLLGILARSQTNSASEDSSQNSNNLLHAFWAPFLLLHLGGPDTITAYSLEDNELWLRHFLGLIVQVGLAFYIFARSWSDTSLTYITIPVFITGIIKYGERTYVLRSSSSQSFKDRLLSDPDPGPDFREIQSRDKQIQFQQLQLQKLRRRSSVLGRLFYIVFERKRDFGISERRRQAPKKATVSGALGEEKDRDPNIDESPAEAIVLHPERLGPSSLPTQETQELQQGADYQQQQQPSTATAPSSRILSNQRQKERGSDPEKRLTLCWLCCQCCKIEEEDIESDPNIIDQDQQPPPKERIAVLSRETIKPDAHYLEVAYFLFKRFRYHFADLILSYNEWEDSYSIVKNKSVQVAFKLAAVELGFMYDELYTKATIVYSPFGILVRFISFCCSVSALVSFSIIIDIHSYPKTDVLVAYVLMIGAVVLEIYAVIMLLLSDWTKLCLIKRNGCCHCQSTREDRKRWSECMGQYNLVSSCFQNVKLLSIGIEKLPWIGKLLEKYQYLTWKDATLDLKDIIFKQLLQKSNEIKGDDGFSIQSCRKLLDHRGDDVLKRYGILDQFRWSISDVEFDHSLLLWHIATDVYYNSENNNELGLKGKRARESSKGLSDYMLYLLVFCPSMLPEGIADIRYRDTLAECMRFFEIKKKLLFISWKKKPSIHKTEACKALLEVRFGPEEEELKGDIEANQCYFMDADLQTN